MRSVRPLVLLVLATLLAAPVASQGSDAISKLEAARARNPQNVAALRALGVAYFKANRHQDAHTVLDQARRLDPRDGVSALYAGLSAEATGDLTAARRAYDDYLRVGRTRRVKDQIRQRLVALSRAEAVAAAKSAVANEARLTQTPGELRTVAVPPLTFSGSDSSLRPLERGMADLLITDLSRSSQLTIVERDRMQALADEIQLSQGDRVDAATAVRAGRLIQAGRLINGQLIQAGSGLILNASVVNVASGQIGDPASVNNTLENLFAMEKQLVFAIFERLGVTLTAAERQLVDRRPTQNLDAFLAYSRGLMAADDGRFDDAARFFENARSLDPGFGAASSRFQAAQAAAQGAQVSAATVEASLSNSAEGAVVQAAAAGNVAPAGGGLTNTLTNAARDLNPSTVTTTATTETAPAATPVPPRDAPTSTGSIDNLTRTGTVVITVRRP